MKYPHAPGILASVGLSNAQAGRCGLHYRLNTGVRNHGGAMRALVEGGREETQDKEYHFPNVEDSIYAQSTAVGMVICARQ